MNPETGEIIPVTDDNEARGKGLIPIPDDQLETVQKMDIEERKEWAAKNQLPVAPLLAYPSSILRQKSIEVTDFGSATQEIIDQLIHTMYYYEGLGLAAPQIGQLLQIFVIDLANRGRNPKGAQQRGEPCGSDLRVFINPKIEHASGAVRCREGCLSFPNISEHITRPSVIDGKALDRNGKEFDFKFENNLFAVAIQHETDHLHGMLMIDYMSKLCKRLVEKKLHKDRVRTKRIADAKKNEKAR